MARLRHGRGTLLASGGRRGAGPAFATAQPVGAAASPRWPAPDGADGQTMVGCGRALIGERIAIVDPETRTRLAPALSARSGSPGRNVAQGYWRNPDATEAVFGAHIAGEEELHGCAPAISAFSTRRASCSSPAGSRT